MTENNDGKAQKGALLQMAADIATAYVGHNSLAPSQIGELLQTIYHSLSGLDGAPTSEPLASKPAVNPKRSVFPDFVICLEDGKKLKMLKRHLRTTYGLSPDEYRVKWGLPADYPMVAPNYAAQRSAFAKKIGLGRKPGGRKSRPK
jgi:predicted transcriptional regulator